ncbi:hypothetical protein DJICPGNB_11245 [Escherichia coli]|nr:hypothetical protein DJICPGNB_11245 [Escherichia coli]
MRQKNGAKTDATARPKSPVRLKKYWSYRGNMGLTAENILQRQFKAEVLRERNGDRYHRIQGWRTNRTCP